MRTLLERWSGRQHVVLAVLAAWLVLTSPWVSMRRVIPEHASLWDQAHIVLGLLAAALSVVYFVTCAIGGGWRRHFPWLTGRLAEAGGDVAGLFRGRIPSTDGAGLFPVVQGLLLVLLLATAVTGTGWFVTEGARAALSWREWHIGFASAFGWCLLIHVAAGLAHVLEFMRD